MSAPINFSQTGRTASANPVKNLAIRVTMQPMFAQVAINAIN